MKVFIDFAPCRLEGAKGEKEGRAVPSYLIQTVEFICDMWYCRCNDCHVESDKEDGENEGDDDGCKLKCTRVIGGCYLR